MDTRPTEQYSDIGGLDKQIHELDPREEPGSVEDLVTGCAMLDSCAEIRTPDTLYNVLTHNFIR